MNDLNSEIAALRRTAAAVLGCSHAAEDVAQEAWLASWRRGRSTSTSADGPTRSWLRGVVRNLAQREIRSRRQEQDAGLARVEELSARHAQAAEAGCPESAAEIAETASLLAKGIRDLPEAYRLVVVQRFWRRESVQEIAASLGVSPKVVSNRLYRALRLLRQGFELHDPRLKASAESTSGPPRSLPALAALAPSRLHSHALTAMKTSTLVASTAAAGLTLTLFVFLSRGSGPTPELDAPGFLTARETADSSQLEPAAAPADLETASLPSVAPHEAAREIAAAGSAPQTPEPKAIQPPPTPALLTWRFIDAETGKKIKRVAAKGASETRFFDRDVKSDKRVALTPGQWSFAFQAKGYEVTEVPSFALAQEQRLDLGEISLQRGWASLSGAIDVPAAVAAKGPFRVELYGYGRSPCAQSLIDGASSTTDGRCDLCGYHADNSVRSVAAGELFQFDRLAAGSYEAIIYDRKGRLRFHEEVRIDVGERSRLDLRMEFHDLDFLVSGPDELPFEGVWVDDGKTYQGPVEFYFSTDGRPCASARTPAESASIYVVGDAEKPVLKERTDRVYLRDPRKIDGEKRARTHARAAAVRAMERSATEPRDSADLATRIAKALDNGRTEKPKSAPPREPDDRRRTEDDSPLFAQAPARPELLTAPLKARFLRPGELRVLEVPIQADHVVLTCGPYFARVELDALRGTTEYEAQLIERCSADSSAFIGSRSCFDCHQNNTIAKILW